MTPFRRKLLIRAMFAVSMALVAIALSLLVPTTDEPAIIFAFRGDILLLATSFAVVGLLLASRRPDNPIGWIFLGTAVVGGVQALAAEVGTYARAAGELRAASIATWVDAWIWVPITGTVAIHIFLLFPTGKLLSPRWRWIQWIGTAGILWFGAAFALGSSELSGLANPFFDVSKSVVDALFLGSLLYLAGVLGGVASLIVRFRRSRGDERQQLKWFAAAATLLGLFLLLVFANEFLLQKSAVLNRLASFGMALSFAAVPITIGIAILKYRLYELDVVVSRTVLYGALVGIITLVYVAIVVGVGSLIGNRGNLLLSILATALIAVAFQPLRERVRRFANRLVYGKRATPYEVLSEFAEGLGSVYSAEEVLPRMARLLGEGTGGTTAIWIHVDDEFRPAAAWPAGNGLTPVPAASAVQAPQFHDWDASFPVLHRDEVLGALTIRKPPSEPLSDSERKLVADVAQQAGLVLGNVRLIEELRASRQRLVTAQDEERRRLERDIHDGAQQQLVAMSVKLRLARNLSAKDPAKAAEMLDQLQAENQETLETLRDLARGIYPPLLADQGLASALDAQGRKAAIPVEVSANGTGRYPQEVEAAAYFCCLEAMQNVAKYAEASRIRIRLWSEDGVLAFSVEDDGRGFDRARTSAGSGLRNMGDRIDALGGTLEIVSAPGEGTTVTGRIPAQPVAAPQASASLSGSNSDLGM
jgi:signal transduction histidine kinase